MDSGGGRAHKKICQGFEKKTPEINGAIKIIKIFYFCLFLEKYL